MRLIRWIMDLIKGLVMKASRFIFNTDYVTPQNDQEVQVSVAIPASFTVPANTIRHFKTTITVPGSSSRNYRAYFTSTLHSYAVVGCVACVMKIGSYYVNVALTHNKDSFTLDVFNNEESSSRTYSGSARVITAHIQTFVDPFQV